jgi:hypothetical protein
MNKKNKPYKNNSTPPAATKNAALDYMTDCMCLAYYRGALNMPSITGFLPAKMDDKTYELYKILASKERAKAHFRPIAELVLKTLEEIAQSKLISHANRKS